TALGLALQDATTAFNLLLLLGAGTGLIFILRWFWWRINAMTEIVAMVSSLVIAGFMTFSPLDLEGWQKTVIGALLTTVVWIVAAFFTPPTTDSKLFDFYKRIRPAGPGWEVVRRRAADQGVALPQGKGQLPLEISCMLIGCLTVYSALFSTGYWIYGKTGTALIFTVLTALGGLFLFSVWNKLKTDEAS
ncbi:MAG TPA: Na+:solute symporter, partial [Flavilitoribacter sp.]|nr:Na+:solute symporter [Flavilitoribacter sp.]